MFIRNKSDKKDISVYQNHQRKFDINKEYWNSVAQENSIPETHRYASTINMLISVLQKVSHPGVAKIRKIRVSLFGPVGRDKLTSPSCPQHRKIGRASCRERVFRAV